MEKNNYLEFSYQTQILEHHLDSFGHVNNATYLELFEEARWDFITRNGYGLKQVQELRQGPIVLDVNCRFKRELINRENITIVSCTSEHKSKIMRIKQHILKENGEVSAEAEFTFGFMDLEKRKMIAMPDAWLKAVGIK